MQSMTQSATLVGCTSSDCVCEGIVCLILVTHEPEGCGRRCASSIFLWFGARLSRGRSRSAVSSQSIWRECPPSPLSSSLLPLNACYSSWPRGVGDSKNGILDWFGARLSRGRSRSAVSSQSIWRECPPSPLSSSLLPSMLVIHLGRVEWATPRMESWISLFRTSRPLLRRSNTESCPQSQSSPGRAACVAAPPQFLKVSRQPWATGLWWS